MWGVSRVISVVYVDNPELTLVPWKTIWRLVTSLPVLATPVIYVIKFVKLSMRSPVTTVFTIAKENNKEHFNFQEGSDFQPIHWMKHLSKGYRSWLTEQPSVWFVLRVGPPMLKPSSILKPNTSSPRDTSVRSVMLTVRPNMPWSVTCRRNTGLRNKPPCCHYEINTAL